MYMSCNILSLLSNLTGGISETDRASFITHHAISYADRFHPSSITVFLIDASELCNAQMDHREENK